MAGWSFPDPKSFPADWDRLWTGTNGLIYQWIERGPAGNVLDVGYWNVVGTVGRQGPMGEQGPMGAPGLHPTINPENNCWVYNYTEYEADGVTESAQFLCRPIIPQPVRCGLLELRASRISMI